MTFRETKIKGVYVIEPTLLEDNRGYFTRVFGKDELQKNGIDYEIVSINRSLSVKTGTIRGMHYQKAPKSEDKIVQCIEGSLFDVALDIREGSKTHGEWIGEVLNAENKKMLLIPKGLAHGFQTLEPNTIVQYFVSEYYAPDYEGGIRWDDPLYAIDWPIKDSVMLSDKDKAWPLR